MIIHLLNGAKLKNVAKIETETDVYNRVFFKVTTKEIVSLQSANLVTLIYPNEIARILTPEMEIEYDLELYLK